jgi:hypothetical protein
MHAISFKSASISVCTFIFFLMQVVWVLPHTAGVRNILLGLCFVFALFYLWDKKKSLSINKSLIPVTLVLTLFLWVSVHYLFFSLNPAIELNEIKGLWLRSIAGVIIAIALATAVKQFRMIRIPLLLSISVIPLINLGVYAYQSLLKGALIPPNEFVTRFLFNKIEAAFFGSISTAICLALLLKHLFKKQKFNNLVAEVILWTFVLLFAISSLISSSKNGVAISLGLIAFFTLCLINLGVRAESASKLKFFILALSLTLIGILVLKGHQSSATPGWSSLTSDLKISMSIKQYENWKNPGLYGYPKNEHGQFVVSNTYERMAWARAGWWLVSKEPLGYGSINNSFKGMLDHQKIQHNVPGQTHSGWTDFALAYGVPGFLIVILSQLSIIYFGLKAKNQWGLIAIWICLALLPLGVIAEICYKQYFESTLFFITFAAVLVVKSTRNS